MKYGKWMVLGLAAGAALAAFQSSGAVDRTKLPKTKWQQSHQARPMAERLAVINAAKPGELRLRATFNAASVCYGAEKAIDGLRLEYRKLASEPGFFAKLFGASCSDWTAALTPPYFEESKDYRGSIVHLEEDTEYEIRLTAAGSTLAYGRVKTWASEVPIAKTVEIDVTAQFPITVSDKGSPTGWIRYTTKPGVKLVRDNKDSFFKVDGAEYVVFDDMRLDGGGGAGGFYPIKIVNSKFVRVRNCEITGWGRTGKVDFTKLARTCTKEGKMINMDAAIHIGKGNAGVVVERCYIHDPLITSCSWFYSHPAGNEAVILGRPDHSTVIRWNDFVGSDVHRYNDAVEGEGNFFEDGGFNRDADIYGNFMIYCNDDNIELDGGQQNVRCFENRFEGALCGISIQGCMVSPVYLFDNIFCGMNDEMQHAGQQIKTSSVDPQYYGPYTYVCNNSFWGPGSFGVAGPTLRGDFRNNLFAAGSKFSGIDKERSPECFYAANSVDTLYGKREGVEQCEIPYRDPVAADFTLTEKLPGVEIANFAPEAGVTRGARCTVDGKIELPTRPLPFILDKGRLLGIEVKKGVVAPAAQKVTARWTGYPDGRADNRPVRFTVRQNDVFDWFKVTPSEGTIGPGQTVEFTVTYIPAKMNDRHWYRGAFQVQTPNGLSRVCSIVAATDFAPPFKAEKAGETAYYFDAFAPTAGKAVVKDDPRGKDGKVVVFTKAALKKKKALEYTFDIPKDGRYYLFIHGASDEPLDKLDERGNWARLKVAVDDDKPEVSSQQAQRYMTWTMLTPGKSQGCMIRWYDWKAGKHTVRIGVERGEFYADGLVATDAPGSFEPR